MADTRSVSRNPSVFPLSLVAGLVFLATTLAHYNGVVAGADQYDDSYITYRCAVNLSEGRGLAFNSGERADCATSLLYAVLLAVLHRLGLHDLERVSLSIGLLGGLWVAMLTAWQCRAMTGSAGAAAFAIPVAMSGWLCGWSVSGMETTLFAALVLTFAVLYSTGRMRAASLVLALAMMTRPEGVLLWLAAGLAAWFARDRLVAGSWLPIGAGALTALALLVFQFAYYGEAIPSPVLYKRVAIYYAPGAARVAAGLFAFVARGLAPAALLAAVWWFSRCARALRSPARAVGAARGAASGDTATERAGGGPLEAREVFLVVYLALTVLSLVAGPASDRYRYATHLFPLLAVAAAGAWERALAPRLPAGWRAAALAVIFVVGVAQAEANQLDTARSFARWSAHQRARKEIGRWIERHAPAGTLVISADLGAIAYYAPSHGFVDATGLTSRVPLRAALDRDWPGLWRWLDRVRPALLADTRWPTGEIPSRRILEQPETFFRGMPPGAAGGRVLALRERPDGPADFETPDGYGFVVRDVAW